MAFLDFIFGKKGSSNQDKPSQPASFVQQRNKKEQSTSSKAGGRISVLQSIIGKYFSLDQLRQIPMGQIRLQPIDGRLAIDPSSQQVVETMAQTTPDISKYLPNLDLSSASAIGKYFHNYCQMTELGYEFGYAIKTGDDGYLGFIFVHTPAMNEKAVNFPHWSIDFCLFKFFQGKGIMTQSIARVLYLLKTEMNVREIYTYVDETNVNCLRMLSRLPFDRRPETLTDPNTGHRALLFCCLLHEINFQSR